MSRGAEAWWAAKARIIDFDKLSYAGKETVQYDIGCERLQTYRDLARATCDRGKKGSSMKLYVLGSSSSYLTQWSNRVRHDLIKDMILTLTSCS